MEKSSHMLTNNGFFHGTLLLENVLELIPEPQTTLGKAIEAVKKLMKSLNHRLYCGAIYKRQKEGKTKS